MRREHFELDVRNIDWVEADGDPEQPVAKIEFSGPAEELHDRLSAVDDTQLDGEQIDVAYRLRAPFEDDEATGVVGVTNRLTGDFIFETNEAAEDVLQFITAAREYGQATSSPDSRYRIRLSFEDGETVTYDKSTFLVYDDEGDLLRSQSLIPSGVEL
ncbi:MAG: hypothetical protein J07HN6_00576 [Halonotius sp. J07HN6]|nr:MAG: hypothetical protein J07HN6_00576 [Halonotius sp. J07HN6]